MSIFTKSFYIHSPITIQECFISMYGLSYKLIREGRLFRKMLSQLEKSQYYSKEELKQVQVEKLKLIVKHAYKNVPYYNRLFKNLRLTPKDFKNIYDLNKIPMIDKETIRKKPEDFLAVNMNRFFIRKIFTSGTTGSPLRLYRDLYSINFENAILRRQYRWAGFYPAEKKMVLRADPIVPSKVKNAPFWRKDFFKQSLMTSVYHLSLKNTPYYVREILRYKPVALDTVPSTGSLLAKLIYSKGMCVNFKYIFTTSEVLMPHHKQVMQDRFKARIFDHYGLAERVAAIGTCERGNYHAYPEYGITEFLPLQDEKGHFEIIGTSLNNFAMPLLRYRTGDAATLSCQECPCGRKFQTLEHIDGRLNDQFFVTRDGRIISLFCQILAIELRDVIETQFIQEDLDSMRVRLVAGKRFSGADELSIKRNMKKYLGNNINVYIEKVPNIPRTDSGKFKQFVSIIDTKQACLVKQKEL